MTAKEDFAAQLVQPANALKSWVSTDDGLALHAVPHNLSSHENASLELEHFLPGTLERCP